ncbi:DUF397 domain-containing protein [Spongiactinospora rosea]|uniref:DUF397 domain-containing protein n=1 Tax=Spongiactinospora rosea TaxID=2248750 RepID=A0A366M4T1_9ACTN|nr:DUF397 domain-containing protein [Spongiactinospora rosea]RBQ20760.1 DUF397 domain-containing protein [Spongiactinospora rosea]
MEPQRDFSQATWRKSSFSGNGASCVEVAMSGGMVAVRDTKNRAGGMLVFRADEWSAFLAGVRLGEFDPSTSA